MIKDRKVTDMIGRRVTTTQDYVSSINCIKAGTEVTIIGVSERGYDIKDDDCNVIIEIGWSI